MFGLFFVTYLIIKYPSGYCPFYSTVQREGRLRQKLFQWNSQACVWGYVDELCSNITGRSWHCSYLNLMVDDPYGRWLFFVRNINLQYQCTIEVALKNHLTRQNAFLLGLYLIPFLITGETSEIMTPELQIRYAFASTCWFIADWSCV